jgi:hypothetical protein
MRLFYWLAWLITKRCCPECGGGRSNPSWMPWQAVDICTNAYHDAETP